jgi:excisionase family DNA binding protein
MKKWAWKDLMNHSKPARLLLRPSEAAELLGLGRSKTYELIASGAIPSVRLGPRCVRVPAELLEKWLATQLENQRDGE